MGELSDALAKHGTAVDAVSAEPFLRWEITQAMKLIALMAKEVAAAEKARR